MSECNSIESANLTINLSKKPRRDTKQSKNYYKNDKKRLSEQARDKHRNLSEEEKNKKREYGKKISEYI